MNLTRAELHAPCNTEEAARTRPVQPKPRPVQPFNTVRVEFSTPHGHAPCWWPVRRQITDTVRAKTRAALLPLLHGPCVCPVCSEGTNTPLLHGPSADPCSFLPSISCCSAHSRTVLLTRAQLLLHKKPNHYHKHLTPSTSTRNLPFRAWFEHSQPLLSSHSSILLLLAQIPNSL